MFLPETSRSVVGIGTQIVSGLHRPLISYFRVQKASKFENEMASESNRIPQKIQNFGSPSSKFRFPNPTTSLKMLGAKDLALVTSIYGIFYMNSSCLQASLSPIFIDLYEFSELNAGLIYLPFVAGSVTGA